MNLSVKNMIFAFAAGLVVFSLIMTALCVGMFNSEIEVAKKGDIKQSEETDILTLDNAVIFKADKKEGKGIDFLVFVMIDNTSKRVLITPVYGDYLIPYKNALSYVSTVYDELGNKAFPKMIKAFSGILVDENNIFDIENAINYDIFKANIVSELENNISGDVDWSNYQIEDFIVALKENQTDNTHERIKQIDTEQCVKKFRNLLGKN